MFEKIPNTCSVKAFLQSYASFLRDIQSTREPLILTKYGIPHYVIISVRDYNQFTKRYKDLEIDQRVNEELKWEKTYEEIRKNSILHGE